MRTWGKTGRLITALFAVAAAAGAHDIITTKLTYTRDISRIFSHRCISCHGEKSSIPLTNYTEVRPWAVSIKEQVLSRAMPPWGAVKGFGVLSPDDGLTQEEILIISAWVLGGAPSGDAGLLPKGSVPAPPNPQKDLAELVAIDGIKKLTKPYTIGAIRAGQETIDSSKIVARLPDGTIEPLIWFSNFGQSDPKLFYFRDPIRLPAGTVVESAKPVRFSLYGAKAASPGR